MTLGDSVQDTSCSCRRLEGCHSLLQLVVKPPCNTLTFGGVQQRQHQHRPAHNDTARACLNKQSTPDSNMQLVTRQQLSSKSRKRLPCFGRATYTRQDRDMQDVPSRPHNRVHKPNTACTYPTHHRVMQRGPRHAGQTTGCMCHTPAKGCT
jgi:hypothetical protein